MCDEAAAAAATLRGPSVLLQLSRPEAVTAAPSLLEHKDFLSLEQTTPWMQSGNPTPPQEKKEKLFLIQITLANSLVAN